MHVRVAVEQAKRWKPPFGITQTRLNQVKSYSEGIFWQIIAQYDPGCSTTTKRSMTKHCLPLSSAKAITERASRFRQATLKQRFLFTLLDRLGIGAFALLKMEFFNH